MKEEQLMYIGNYSCFLESLHSFKADLLNFERKTHCCLDIGTQPIYFQLQFIKQAKLAWSHGVTKTRVQKKLQAKLRQGRWKLIFDIDGPWIVNEELSAFCLRPIMD